ncbi:tetratricopeptide repeat protein [Streptomyces sp. CC219B]|uniref:tetratricopeptide repeat protein n=1 Tax=Streptomyces sp. CC219B TaxID=3044574 RepID=UPI0024A9EB3A|nr:tetratricopeptide repeat protein [Streptomyces sp. CC219B]
MTRLSRAKKREQQQAGPSATPLGAPLDVRVPAAGPGAGTASVDGEPVVPAPGQEVQQAVLAHLHRIALAAGRPVLATVHDERIGCAVPLQVNPDGSSVLTAEPTRDTSIPDTPTHLLRRTRPTTPATPTPPTGTFGPPPPMHPDPDPHPHPLPTPPSTPAPAPTPIFTPAPALDPEPKPTPPRGFDAVAEAVLDDEPTVGGAGLLAEPVARVNEAVREGRTQEAARLAEETVAQASRALGPEHPEVLRLRELTAYIAYLAGDPTRALTLSLDLARLHRRARDGEAAYGNVLSAATAWRAVRDPEQGLRLGRELIDLWTALAADGGPAAEEPDRLESAHARMRRLTDRARRSGS